MLEITACGRVGFELLPLDGGPGTQDGGGATVCSPACVNEHGEARCVEEQCVLHCDEAYGDCNGDPTDGCEARLDQDPDHCGACGQRCDLEAPACNAGRCEAQGCPLGLGECEAAAAASCKTNLLSSEAHCGACGRACEAAHATPQCVEGTCTIASCDAGFDDCDGDPSTGCEAALATDAAHCGACGAACLNEHGSTVCVQSACAPTCEPGFDDCDGDPRNGCENSLDTLDHCGACGQVCSVDTGTPVCVAGRCESVCDLNGTWALKIAAPVTWRESDLLDAGSGTYFLWMKATLTQAGSGVSMEVSECGRAVPEFESKIPNERHLLHFPNSLFEAALPRASSMMELPSPGPGANVTVMPLATELGLRMDDPVNDLWPREASEIPESQRVDMDLDGKPGITAVYANQDPYEYPRVSLLVSPDAPRSDTLYAASRAVFSLDGTLTTCDRSTGTANVTAIQTRVYGGNRSDSDEDVGELAASFMDANVMDYAVGASNYTLLKIADDADCATVRATLP